MASNIFDVQPPAWLERIAKPINAVATGQTIGALAGGLINAATTGKPVGESVSDSFQEISDPLWQYHKAESGLRLDLGRVGLETAKFNLDNAKFDAATVPQWLQQDWRTRLEGPLPPVKTPQALAVVTRQRMSDIKMLSDQTKDVGVVTAIKSFNGRVDQLSKLDPEAAGPFLAQVGKVPSPTINQALSVAIAAAQQRQKNIASQAELDAIARGDREVTTITDKGVTKSFRPPTSAEMPTAHPEPIIKKYGNDEFLFYRNYAPRKLDKTSSTEIKRLSSKLTDAQIKVDAAAKNPDDPYALQLAKNNLEAIKAQLDKLAGPGTVVDQPSNAPATSSGLKYTIVPE